jgi:hypothetical protein
MPMTLLYRCLFRPEVISSSTVIMTSRPSLSGRRRREQSLSKVVSKALAALLLASVGLNLIYHARLPDAHLRHPFGTDAVDFNNPDDLPLLWKLSGQVVKKDKNGRIVHHNIQKIDSKVLQNAGDDTTTNSSSFLLMTHNSTSLFAQAQRARAQLLAQLADAGVQDIDVHTIGQLPTDAQVHALYGDRPVVYGLDRCPQFRENLPKSDASLGVAGLFNTGTNPLAMYLAANCVLADNKSDRAGHGMRWQVPW